MNLRLVGGRPDPVPPGLRLPAEDRALQRRMRYHQRQIAGLLAALQAERAVEREVRQQLARRVLVRLLERAGV